MAKKQTRPTFVTPEPYFTKGGQGKLFRDPKPVEQHRYQRGYTPERMQAVREELEPKTFALSQNRPLKEHFIQSVARSTVPTSTLGEKALKHVSISSSFSPSDPGMMGETETMVGMNPWSGEKKVIEPSTVKMFHGASRLINPNWSENLRRQVFGLSSIHELGHVEDAVRRPHMFPKVGAGNREERADIFMEKHFRHDPRDVRRGRPTIGPEEFTYAAREFPAGPGYKSYAIRSMEQRAHMRTAAQRILTQRQFQKGQGQLFGGTTHISGPSRLERVLEEMAKSDVPNGR